MSSPKGVTDYLGIAEWIARELDMSKEIIVKELKIGEVIFRKREVHRKGYGRGDEDEYYYTWTQNVGTTKVVIKEVNLEKGILSTHVEETTSEYRTTASIGGDYDLYTDSS